MNKTTAGVICSVSLIIGLVVANHGQEVKTSQAGLELIGNAEGCRTTPYYCPANMLTIGIGTTNHIAKIELNKRYTEQEIAELFTKGIKQAESCVNRYANGANLPQGAFDALVSLSFNIGCTKLKNSTIYRLAQKGYSPQLCQELKKWIYVNGKPSQGLKNRREKEFNLCSAL